MREAKPQGNPLFDWPPLHRLGFEWSRFDDSHWMVITRAIGIAEITQPIFLLAISKKKVQEQFLGMAMWNDSSTIIRRTGYGEGFSVSISKKDIFLLP
ncbi:hypothetical protein CRG98_042029 [Punica granatum]|uniref:Uncharacterized protein n=1 Tax=Punica granatum TaxID=22663 RepID=A0A2I0I0W8_PUNGR|nr:hypothetical protein CRG98_042029 [Punica granatum]